MELEGINKRLFDWAMDSPLLKTLNWLETNEQVLKQALGNNKSDRFDATIMLCNLIWNKYPEIGVSPNLFLLGEMEVGQNFYPNYRDHSTHIFKVYLLGLYIYENNLTIHKLFDEKDNFISVWTVASLWHDMGYLFDNEQSEADLGKLWETVSNRINEQFKRSLNFVAGINMDIAVLKKFYDISRIEHCPLKSLSEFEKDKSLFEHLRSAGIEAGLATSSLNSNSIMEIYSVIRSYASGIRKEHIDHGIFGALLLLKLWFSYRDMLSDIVSFIDDQKNNNTTNLILGAVSSIKRINTKITDSQIENIIKKAAKAISLHNIKLQM